MASCSSVDIRLLWERDSVISSTQGGILSTQCCYSRIRLSYFQEFHSILQYITSSIGIEIPRETWVATKTQEVPVI